jgi:ParB family chromosome partitioning protein
MPNKSRPSVSSFLSTSSKARQTQQELAEAQERIAALEQELAAERQRLESQVQGQKVSQATVPINQILRRPYQSRREKDPQVFDELVHSIKTYGFRGSIWVQSLPENRLRLIAGETRLDAAIAAGLTEIPVDIVETDDVTAVKLSRVENARRRNMNALDDTEELLYLLTLTLSKSRTETKKLLYQYKNASEGNSSIDPQIRETIEILFEEVAPELEVMTFVSSRLPLLELPTDVLQVYNTGQLAYTKAIELGRVEDERLRQALLQETIEQGLSLSALKARIRPTSPRTALDRMNKLRQPIEAMNQKSISKLSLEQRKQLKQTIEELSTLLEQKLKDLENLENS